MAVAAPPQTSAERAVVYLDRRIDLHQRNFDYLKGAERSEMQSDRVAKVRKEQDKTDAVLHELRAVRNLLTGVSQ